MTRTSYIVVGGGPAGLFTALLLGMSGHRVTVIERQAVLGGCHRVDRVAGRFSEHGPRIYVTNYLCYRQFLALCGLDFDEHYIDYKYGFLVGWEGLREALTRAELAKYAALYALFIVNPDSFRTVSVERTFRGFSKRAIDYLDKMCTLTDGARASDYTAHAFFSIFDQNALYRIVEPTQANDKWLWPAVRQTLARSNVTVVRDQAMHIIEAGGRALGVQCTSRAYLADRVVLATPPAATALIMAASSPIVANAFMPRAEWPAYVDENTYIPYLSFTVHFDTPQELPNVWGNGFGEWGVAWIVMSDYFTNESPTLISGLIHDLDTVSRVTGATANQTTDADAMTREAYRQLAQVLGIDEKPNAIVLNPSVYYADGRWRTHDVPFMNTHRTKFVPAIGRVPNLSWVGPHNGQNSYPFTSMESVCENVYAFCAQEEPQVRNLIQPRYVLTLSIVIRSLFITITLLYLVRKAGAKVDDPRAKPAAQGW